MIRKTLGIVILVICASLSACDGGDDVTEVGTMPSRMGDLQRQFGDQFAQIFNQPATAEPVDVQPGDAGMLDMTGEPIEF